MRVLDEQAVRAALPMREALAAVADVMAADHDPSTWQPLRTHLDPPALDGVVLVKPAATPGALGMKVLTICPDNPSRGVPAINGFVSLIDPSTGVVQALVHGGAITEIRTAAASGVATDALARHDAGDLALLGAGAQARSHLAAMTAVRDLRRVRVWSRTTASAERFATWASTEGHQVEVCMTAQAAVDGADLVCTVTSASDPVLAGEWLAPGVHVNAVGAFQPDSRELATSVVTGGDHIVVDSLDSAATEAGDLLIPAAEGVVLPEAVELGAVLRGEAPGRTGPGERTVFESLGLAIQDVATAARALSIAETDDLDLGVQVDF